MAAVAERMREPGPAFAALETPGLLASVLDDDSVAPRNDENGSLAHPSKQPLRHSSRIEQAAVQFESPDSGSAHSIEGHESHGHHKSNLSQTAVVLELEAQADSLERMQVQIDASTAEVLLDPPSPTAATANAEDTLFDADATAPIGAQPAFDNVLEMEASSATGDSVAPPDFTPHVVDVNAECELESVKEAIAIALAAHQQHQFDNFSNMSDDMVTRDGDGAELQTGVSAENEAAAESGLESSTSSLTSDSSDDADDTPASPAEPEETIDDGKLHVVVRYDEALSSILAAKLRDQSHPYPQFKGSTRRCRHDCCAHLCQPCMTARTRRSMAATHPAALCSISTATTSSASRRAHAMVMCPDRSPDRFQGEIFAQAAPQQQDDFAGRSASRVLASVRESRHHAAPTNHQRH